MAHTGSRVGLENDPCSLASGNPSVDGKVDGAAPKSPSSASRSDHHSERANQRTQ